MGDSGIVLERVRRTSGGRVHLTPHVPESGAVVTLCDQTLAAETYEASAADADCRNCLRRQSDPARISGAFFRSDAGVELLQRSLDSVRARPARPAATRSAGATPGPAPASTSRRQQQPRTPVDTPSLPEVRSRTPLRRAFENVYVSPEGVILRVSGNAVTHVTFTGSVDVRARRRTVVVRVGDVVLELGTS